MNSSKTLSVISVDLIVTAILHNRCASYVYNKNCNRSKFIPFPNLVPFHLGVTPHTTIGINAIAEMHLQQWERRPLLDQTVAMVTDLYLTIMTLDTTVAFALNMETRVP